MEQRRLGASKIRLLISLLLLFYLSCSFSHSKNTDGDERFRTKGAKKDNIPFATEEVLNLHETNLNKSYRIGPGDLIYVNFWNREKLSGEHIVGPFGKITLPMIGEFHIGGHERKKGAELIGEQYGRYYKDPIITIKILKYLNNKVYILGRVTAPGVVHFSGQGSLLEAISRAGGIPTRNESVSISKCYIIRGKHQIIWVDLMQLLQRANTRLNVPLANDDIIYIPENLDESVFVMGEVNKPGSYHIRTSDYSLLDAVNQAGGPTKDANIKKIRLIRNFSEGEKVQMVNLKKVLKQGDFSVNYLLDDNDIIYIPPKGIAKLNYYINQIDPFLRTFITGVLVHTSVTGNQ